MLTPSEFLDSYCEIGYKKARSPAGRILLLAILAGILIGMGAVVSNTSSHALENLSVARVVCGFLFPFGLVMVLFTGAELFTGNCLITIPVLERRVAWTGMLRNLCWVYIGNLIGAVLLAAVIVYSGQLNLSDGALAVCTIRTAAAKCSLSFGRAVVLGILCNVLVCIGVMCGLCAKSAAGRTLGAFLPVCFFVICGFEHCVANMYYIPAGLLALEVPHYAELAREAGVAVESLTWSRFFLQNLTAGHSREPDGRLWICRADLERLPSARAAGAASPCRGQRSRRYVRSIGYGYPGFRTGVNGCVTEGAVVKEQPSGFKQEAGRAERGNLSARPALFAVYKPASRG